MGDILGDIGIVLGDILGDMLTIFDTQFRKTPLAQAFLLANLIIPQTSSDLFA